MLFIKKAVQILVTITTVLLSLNVFAGDKINIPILCYHNFNPTRPGSMNLRPQVLEEQILWLKNHGYTIIPLQEAVDYLQGKRPTLPEKSVVITADDGWQSVYTYLYPLVKKYHFPVTLFIYPETISSGKNTMTWEELHELQNTGLFDIEGHTYSHPNFKQERKHISEERYEKFVAHELAGSKAILEKKMNKPITLLAWPFGIYDDYLENAAKKAGYTMAFTINYEAANKSYRPMAEPRFMIVASQSMNTFTGIVKRANP